MKKERQDPRYKKQYTVNFSLKDHPDKTETLSGLLDISKGGLKFGSYEKYDVGMGVVFRIQFPFLYPQAIKLQGTIVGVQQVPMGKLYRISVKFVDLDEASKSALEQMEKINQKSAL
ncbi:MAG: PilZ domain-containing protein [Candidatus Omnitrophica bacterium]|nr:PilZ domain-containing protein [Candidatus Omnitrophota bacterium]